MVHINEEQVAFYVELGTAITQWAHIERQLCEVATLCMSDRKGLYHPDLYAAFFSIENFRSKTQYADTIVTRYLTAGSALHQQWMVLLDRMRTLSAERNKLAHRPLVVYPHFPEGRRFALEERETVPAPKPKIAQKYPPGALFIRDVVQCRLRFFALSAALSNFVDRLFDRPEQRSKDAEQPRSPPTTAQIVRQTREVFERRAQSSRARPQNRP